MSNTPDQPYRHIDIRESAAMRPGGFGILLASEIVDELIYSETGNEVLLIKYLANSDLPSNKSHTREAHSADDRRCLCLAGPWRLDSARAKD